MDIIKVLLKIIENPNAKKGYLDLEKYLQENNMLYEAGIVKQLIEKRFET